MKKVIYPNADCLAGVLLTQPSMLIHKDVWRNKGSIKVVVTLKNYVDFLCRNIDLTRYFSLRDEEIIKHFSKTGDKKTAVRIYPLFVRDVMLAAIAEISEASSKKKEFTEIVYEPPSHKYKRMKANRLPNYDELIQNGRRFLLSEEGKGRIKHIEKCDEPYGKAIELYTAVIGYTLFAEENHNKFMWILY